MSATGSDMDAEVPRATGIRQRPRDLDPVGAAACRDGDAVVVDRHDLAAADAGAAGDARDAAVRQPDQRLARGLRRRRRREGWSGGGSCARGSWPAARRFRCCVPGPCSCLWFHDWRGYESTLRGTSGTDKSSRWAVDCLAGSALKVRPDVLAERGVEIEEGVEGEACVLHLGQRVRPRPGRSAVRPRAGNQRAGAAGRTRAARWRASRGRRRARLPRRSHRASRRSRPGRPRPRPRGMRHPRRRGTGRGRIARRKRRVAEAAELGGELVLARLEDLGIAARPVWPGVGFLESHVDEAAEARAAAGAGVVLVVQSAPAGVEVEQGSFGRASAGSPVSIWSEGSTGYSPEKQASQYCGRSELRPFASPTAR